MWIIAVNNDANKVRFGSSGACEALVTVLKTHSSNPQVLENACGAMGKIANDNDANKVRFGSSGACEALVTVLKTHSSNPQVLEKACGAMWNIAGNNDANKVRFGSSGACEAFSCSCQHSLLESPSLRECLWGDVEN